MSAVLFAVPTRALVPVPVADHEAEVSPPGSDARGADGHADRSRQAPSERPQPGAGRFIRLAALSGFTLALATGSALATDVSEIEMRRLFEPTQSELHAEAAGRIYIYDGLRDIDVARAMEEEYVRIENMMFVRVKQTDAKGEVLKDPETGMALVEDDGC